MILATTRLASMQQLGSTWTCGGELTEMVPVKPAVVFSRHPKIVEQLAKVVWDSKSTWCSVPCNLVVVNSFNYVDFTTL